MIKVEYLNDLRCFAVTQPGDYVEHMITALQELTEEEKARREKNIRLGLPPKASDATRAKHINYLMDERDVSIGLGPGKRRARALRRTGTKVYPIESDKSPKVEAGAQVKLGQAKPGWKKLIVEMIPYLGVVLAVRLVPIIIKSIMRRSNKKKRDEALARKNNRLNTAIDNYKNKGIAVDRSSEGKSKYLKTLHDIVGDVLEFQRLSGSSDDNDDPTIYTNTIAPFLGVLRAILIDEVAIITGTVLGADRRKFELVYNPENLPLEDLVKKPFREVIFSHPWPSHGFDVSTMGGGDANKLINSTLEFLAENPNFLQIRV